MRTRESRLRRSAWSLFSALDSALAVHSAQAQSEWPSTPVRLIVPYPSGGSSDIIARAISQPLSEALRQPVLVENRTGANGNLGADLVAKAAPDGHTLLLCDVGALAISPSVHTKLPFDPSKDLRGVTVLAYSPHLLVAHASVPANNLRELVALSRKTDMNFAVTATGARRTSQACCWSVPVAGAGSTSLQRWRAGDPGHDRWTDADPHKRHACHLAARAERQAEGPRPVQGHANAAAR